MTRSGRFRNDSHSVSCSSDIKLNFTGRVAVVEMQRPPNNFFDQEIIEGLADMFAVLDDDDRCRCVVLASEGKHFCAGADFGGGADDAKAVDAAAIYEQAIRLFRTRKPVVAAVQGAAVGGGLGLALVADFRVTCEAARFSANFTRLGFHPGFGLTATLPDVVGAQQARLMLYTGRRFTGGQAREMGLADLLVPCSDVRDAALTLAREIADAAPLAVQATRATLKAGLAERVARATEHELAEQTRLRKTDDFREGVRAMQERKRPEFRGR